jgi:hypothetical protein
VRRGSIHARKAHALAPGDYNVDALFDDAARHFSTQGWTVQEYRTEGGGRALTALRDDVGVLVTVPALSVTVTAGPCGRDLTAVSPDRFQPVAG